MDGKQQGNHFKVCGENMYAQTQRCRKARHVAEFSTRGRPEPPLHSHDDDATPTLHLNDDRWSFSILVLRRLRISNIFHDFSNLVKQVIDPFS